MFALVSLSFRQLTINARCSSARFTSSFWPLARLCCTPESQLFLLCACLLLSVSHTSFPADHDLGPPRGGDYFLDAREMAFQHFLLTTKEGDDLSGTDKGEAEVKEGSHEGVRGHVVLHHEKASSRLQDANDLLQCLILRVALELVEGVRAGDHVESAVREGKAPCVGFHQTDVGQALGLVLGHLQHAMGKIHANNLAIRSDLCLHVGENRTRTCAEVENRTSVLYGNLVDQKLPGQALLVAGMKSDKAIIEPRKLVVVGPSPASHESSLAAKR